MRVGLVLALAALAAGCSSSSPPNRSLLTAGIGVRGCGAKPHRIGAKAAVAGGRRSRVSWKADLLARAQRYPAERYDNPSREGLIERLHEFAKRYDFEVVSARVLRPRQDAPMIVVRTTHYLRLARAMYAISKDLNARYPVSDDRKGWRYEGFYWEARDEQGVPFFVTSTLTRGQVMGQQWARSEPLFPFAHGSPAVLCGHSDVPLSLSSHY